MEKSKIYFFLLWGFGYRLEVGPFLFLEGLEITFQSIFFSAWWDNIRSVKKIKKNMEKSKIIFFYSWVLILVGSRPIF